MESKQIKLDCQKAYESLQAYIINNAKFSNEHLSIQISLRDNERISTEQYNRVLDILERINSIVLVDLSEARKYYNLLKTRNDIDFNKISEEEILMIWGDDVVN